MEIDILSMNATINVTRGEKLMMTTDEICMHGTLKIVNSRVFRQGICHCMHILLCAQECVCVLKKYMALVFVCQTMSLSLFLYSPKHTSKVLLMVCRLFAFSSSKDIINFLQLSPENVFMFGGIQT